MRDRTIPLTGLTALAVTLLALVAALAAEGLR
jgi:hypothetical protein